MTAIPEWPVAVTTAAELKRGEHLYVKTCGMCHGGNLKSAGSIPDLRMMSEERREQFEAIVLGGMLAEKGMASFADVLDSEDVALIESYISFRAMEDRAEAELVKIEKSANKLLEIE